MCNILYNVVADILYIPNTNYKQYKNMKYQLHQLLSERTLIIYNSVCKKNNITAHKTWETAINHSILDSRRKEAKIFLWQIKYNHDKGLNGQT